MKTSDVPREFNAENFGKLVDLINTLTREIEIFNMAGQVVENIEIGSTEEVRISHNLKVVPKYRIILRQSGEVFDGETEWTDKYIYLRAKSSFDGVFQKDIGMRLVSSLSPNVASACVAGIAPPANRA